MKRAIVKRSFRHGADAFEKGRTIQLDEGQFDDWAAVGLIEEAPAIKPRAKAKPKGGETEPAAAPEIDQPSAES